MLQTLDPIPMLADWAILETSHRVASRVDLPNVVVTKGRVEGASFRKGLRKS